MRYFFTQQIVEEGFLGNYIFCLYPPTYFPYILGVFFALGALIAVCAYLLGSINSAIIISKGIYKYDVRDYGSGNAGMTNMFRSFGKKAGFLTLGGDVLKALIAVLIGFFVLGSLGQYIAGFFCMLGHSFPVYFKFKGGKGVLVSAITILLIDPVIFLFVLLIFGLMFAATQIISASSITAAFFYPLLVHAFGNRGIGPLSFALLMAFFVIALHKDNIHRILNKTEKKFTIKKNK
jgi:glycerol-3-phosphate acyltransferase PlsY